MCHVWQFEHGVNVELKGAFDRNYKYAGPNFGKISFDQYGIEQQVQMVEDYYLIKVGYTSDYTPKPTPSLATYEKIIPFLRKK